MSKSQKQRGQSLVEFSLVVVLLLMTLLTVFEMCRMVLVYTSVANAAKTGVRYAIVHGSNSPVSTSAIQTVVKNYLKAAPVDTTQAGLSIPVTYPDGCTNPGCKVQVSVVYPYDAWIRYFSLSVNLRSSSQGVITF